MRTAEKVHARLRRHTRVRKRVFGTPSRPRLAVFRSNRHIYAQIIDDTQGRTLVSASTLDTGIRSELKGPANVKASAEVGRAIAGKALEKGIENVVFDRGGFLYHGQVKQVAESARQAGLKF